MTRELALSEPERGPLPLDGATTTVLLLTTAHDEARHLPRVVEAIAAQTRRPDRWVIVDDGSSDGSLGLLEQIAAEFDWVTVLRRGPAAGRIPDRHATAAVPRALNWALRRIDLKAYTHVGKLDADIVVPPEFLERLLDGFNRDRRLGMAGAAPTEWTGTRWRRLVQPSSHPPAPARLYMRECFEACGGFRERLAWDTMDQVYARMHGFSTATLPGLEVRHLRALGSADGRLRGRARHGRCAWIVHQPVGWVAVRSLMVGARFRPWGLAGAAFMAGDAWSAVRRVPRVEDPAFRRFIRAELRARVGTRARAVVGRRR